MTREEFIKVLVKEGYSYKIKGDKLIVTHGGDVNLPSLKTLSSGVKFNNEGSVGLNLLKTLPPGVEFNNEKGVGLDSLETIPPGVVFKNGGYVNLYSLKTLPPGVVFNNRGNVYLGSSLIRGYFHEWKGNIEGISPNTLLNGMIKRGIFL